VLFAHPSVAFHDVKELINYSKANPGKLSVGTPGVGTPHHLAAAWLNTAAKVTITHVPYRGAAPALNDLLGGQIPLIWASPVAVMPYVEQGKVRALGVSTQRRYRMLPQVPTVSESGVLGFDTVNWFGIAAPARVPLEVVARVGQAIREITELSDTAPPPCGCGLGSFGCRDHQRCGRSAEPPGLPGPHGSRCAALRAFAGRPRTGLDQGSADALPDRARF
jgi:tripartite-type tricarboxylate transporter receptor subunit TctC